MVQLAEQAMPVSVRIAGVSAPKPEQLEAIRTLVSETGLNQQVTVLLNPDDWIYRDRKPRKILASVTLGNGTDLGLLLIEKRIVHFHPPPPYKMSRNLACRYALADRQGPAKDLNIE